MIVPFLTRMTGDPRLASNAANSGNSAPDFANLYEAAVTAKQKNSNSTAIKKGGSPMKDSRL